MWIVALALRRPYTFVVMALLISVLQRRRELGLLRAVGATQPQILKTVLAEATLMGILGTILGLLRDFDLQTRLFRYPLSYMIYDAAFDALPDLAKERIYQRLLEILTGKDQSEAYARLSAADRRAILEIVRETKRGLPADWSEAM